MSTSQKRLTWPWTKPCMHMQHGGMGDVTLSYQWLTVAGRSSWRPCPHKTCLLRTLFLAPWRDAAFAISLVLSRTQCMATTSSFPHLARKCSWWWQTPDPELNILNRSLRWCKDGSAVAADLRHAREVIDELGLRSKPGASPVAGRSRVQLQCHRCHRTARASLITRDAEATVLHRSILVCGVCG